MVRGWKAEGGEEWVDQVFPNACGSQRTGQLLCPTWVPVVRDGLKNVNAKTPVFREVAKASGMAGALRKTPMVDPTSPPSPAAARGQSPL